MNIQQKTTLTLIITCFMATAAIITWWVMQQPILHEDIVSANGRTEATGLDITTKTPERIEKIQAPKGNAVQTTRRQHTALRDE